MNRRLMLGVISIGVMMGTTAAQGEAPAKPDTVWPNSWIALGTAILLAADIIARAFGLYRVGAGAIEKKLDDQTKHFDERLIEVERRLEQKFNGFTSNSELRMNGFGQRLSEVESDQTGLNAKQTMLEVRMATSEMDRDHINRALAEIKQGQDTLLRHILKNPRS